MLLVHHEGHEEHEGSRSVRKAGGSQPLLWKKRNMWIFLVNFAASREDDFKFEGLSRRREDSEGNSTQSLSHADAGEGSRGTRMARLLVVVKSHDNPTTSWPGHPCMKSKTKMCVIDRSEPQAWHIVAPNMAFSLPKITCHQSWFLRECLAIRLVLDMIERMRLRSC